MEKNELAMIKAENDRLVTDIDKLRQRLREEITRTQAGVRLDLNLEKGRLREQSSGQELKIKEVETRIEQEIAALRTQIQSSKVRNRRWFAFSHTELSRRQQHCNILLGLVSSSLSVQVQALTLLIPVTGCSALLMAYLRFRV